jgi:hypothetical protein
MPNPVVDIDPVSTSRVDVDLNKDRKENYRSSANAVELMPQIQEQNGKIKLTTKVNSNLVIGDIVYLSALSGSSSGYTDFSYILDNVIEVSGCTDWWYHPYAKGYKVIDLQNKKNEIVINRDFDEKLRDKSIYNHYLTKITVEEQYFKKGMIDCVVFKNVTLNEQISATTITNDIDIHQAIILSGVTKCIEFKDKYDQFYKTINTKEKDVTSNIFTTATTRTRVARTSTSTNIISNALPDTDIYSYYYTNNNDKYSYTIVKNQFISGSTIDNGYFSDCIIVYCEINYGSFVDCDLSYSTINNGYFSGSTINSTCTWLYGIWDDGNFLLPSFNDGIWNSGNFINKTWIYGIFNNGTFSGSTWLDGLFNGGYMVNSNWTGGTFNNGEIVDIVWSGGTFNNGTFLSSIWYDGIFNNGIFSSSVWYNGYFKNGTIKENSTWWNGYLFGGNFLNSIWHDGTWINGTMRNSIWYDGTFNNGYMIDSEWLDGTFNNGTFDARQTGLTYTTTLGVNWSNGTFNGGNFNNAVWQNGTFNNGVVNNSIFLGVNWINGVFNGLYMGPIAIGGYGSDYIINWSGGTWNWGTFGLPREYWDLSFPNPPGAHMIMNWLDGQFYDGNFWNSGVTTGPSRTFWGGWSGGTFYNGNFYGDFFGGDWVQGNFSSDYAYWWKSGSAPQDRYKNIKYLPYTPPAF